MNYSDYFNHKLDDTLFTVFLLDQENTLFDVKTFESDKEALLSLDSSLHKLLFVDQNTATVRYG